MKYLFIVPFQLLWGWFANFWKENLKQPHPMFRSNNSVIPYYMVVLPYEVARDHWSRAGKEYIQMRVEEQGLDVPPIEHQMDDHHDKAA